MEVKPGYKQTDVGVIPEEWDVESLGQITDPRRTICYGIVQVGHFANNGIPVLAIKNLNGDYATNIHHCSPEIEKAYVRSRVRPGDVLVSVKGTIGQVGLVPNHYAGNISRDLARISLTDSDAPEFWYQLLQSEMAQRRLAATTVGTTRLELSIGPLKQVRMPRPPKVEQYAIAKSLSDVDALLGMLDRLIAKKRDLKQAAVQQLLTGQTRLAAERKPKIGSKWTDAGLIPEDWEVKPLGAVLCKGQLGGNYPNRDAEAQFPLMKMGNLGRGYFDVSSVEWVVPGVEPDPAHRLRRGDVLFNTRNTLELVGKVAIWRDELREAYYNSNLMRLEFNSEVVCSNEYANCALNAAGAVARLRALATGTTSVAAIYTRDLMRLPFIVPPKREQITIAGLLSDMDAEIAGLEQRRDKNRGLKQAMMQELLTGRTRLVTPEAVHA